MSENGKIDGKTTVREVMARYPEAEEIFNRYGLTGCGGPNGPLEPIAFFATVHHVDPDRLIAELNELIAKREVQGRAVGPKPMEKRRNEGPELYKAFLKSAIVIALTAGCTWGAVNLTIVALRGAYGLPWWQAVVQAHGHAQIFGWVGFFIMGVAYHIFPRFKASPLRGARLAEASFYLMLAGIALRTLSGPFFDQHPSRYFAIAGGALELIAVSLFAYVSTSTFAASQQAPGGYEKYIYASIAWFWLQTAAGLAILLYMASRNLNAIPAWLDIPYLHIQLWGFVVMMILGVSLRIVPVFMGLKEPKKSLSDLAFWMINLGVAAHASFWLLNAVYPRVLYRGVVGVAAAVEVVGAILYVYNLGIFRKRAMDMRGEGLDRGYEKFIIASYVWFTIASLMLLGYTLYETVTGKGVPFTFSGSYRHAITVGFISMMIFGVSARIIPVFKGVRFHSVSLLNATFLLANLGSFMRAFFQILVGIFGGAFFKAIGVSGWVEVIAIALFGYNLWRTMDKSLEEEDDKPSPVLKEITKDTKVAQVLDVCPDTLEVFLRHGFTQLKNPLMRKAMAGRVTLEQACRIGSMDVEQ